MKGKIWFVASLLLFALLQSLATEKRTDYYSGLARGFSTPPDSIQTSVYWYWISDNISKEGVVRDLQEMKRVGINRAFIGNIGLDDVAYGKVKMLSPEWWEILHAALKTATALNIEIGIFNSPGWSQSGGPWVKPGEAMRYLTSGETRVKGPVRYSAKLAKPAELFQDVKVIAYPVREIENANFDLKAGKLVSTPAVQGLESLLDGKTDTGITIPEGGEFCLDFTSGKPFRAQSLVIQPTAHVIYSEASLQVKDSNGQYRTLRDFVIDRTNPHFNVGFDPYAPISISFEACSSNNFRLVFKKTRANSALAEVKLSATPVVERYSEKTLAKMYQTPLPYWKEYQWPRQAEADPKSVVSGKEVIDLSGHMSADGTLTWDVPAGNWVILRTGMTPTGTKNSPASPEATGFEVDKMSKKHVEAHFYGHMGEILKRIPAEDRKTFKVVVQDSYETGGQNFTDTFLSEFRSRYGYDPVPYLPVYRGVVVESQDASDRFLWDMRRLVADKVAYDYVGGLREISHKYGLRTWLECYGHWGFPSEFLMYGGQSDEIGGEFWSEGELGNIENRAASSCGHIYGKTKISAESNTCGGAAFSRYPATIKQRGDRFFAEGINNTLLHVYITQPYEDKNPGVNAGFGNEFNRKNTWFSQLDVYIQYLKRSNMMLQQGLNVADVAYFIGEDAPKMTGIVDPQLPVGYQFDYMNAEVIEKYMSVRDGKLTLPHGTQYRVLVLPKLETMRPELLRKIKQLVEQGAVVVGPAPRRSPSLQNQPRADQEVASLSKSLWGDVDGVKKKMKIVGKGKIINGMSMEEALSEVKCVPDCKLPSDNTIHYGHRMLKDGEIYFISNQTDQEKAITPEFRVRGMQPELWMATTGTLRDLPDYQQKGESTAVPLKLAPYESAFVVFHKKAVLAEKKAPATNYPAPTVLVNIKGPWKVQFDSKRGGPVEAVSFNTLTDWSESTDERIRYYSGEAVYTTHFPVDQSIGDKSLILDLGKLTAMAKVQLNGAYVGGVWTAPYVLDVTKQVKTGDNELKITVVNTWLNRIVGDLNLPADRRTTWMTINPYKANTPLQPSGLFGPVTISNPNY